MKLAVAAPIRDRAWILPDWFAHLARAAKRAEEDGHAVEFIFLENDSVDETPQMCATFADLWPTILLKHDFGYAHYKVPFADRTKAERVNPHNDKAELAQLRNLIVETFLHKTEAAYLIMWDSDVIMPRETLSRDPRSLVSIMERLPHVGTLCADVEHPHCSGKFHNYMLRVHKGYNHPNRMRMIPAQEMLYQFIVGTQGQYITPSRAFGVNWDEQKLLYVTRVGTTGGGGAAIIRRLVLEAGARYGAHLQGEDITLCEAIREQGQEVAAYSGIRGLHMPRDLYAGPLDLQQPYGEWIEDWATQTQVAA
jgi:hypothetical protein